MGKGVQQRLNDGEIMAWLTRIMPSASHSIPSRSFLRPLTSQAVARTSHHAALSNSNPALPTLLHPPQLAADELRPIPVENRSSPSAIPAHGPEIWDPPIGELQPPAPNFPGRQWHKSNISNLLKLRPFMFHKFPHSSMEFTTRRNNSLSTGDARPLFLMRLTHRLPRYIDVVGATPHRHTAPRLPSGMCQSTGQPLRFWPAGWERQAKMSCHVGPTTTCHSYQRNHPSKELDDQI